MMKPTNSVIRTGTGMTSTRHPNESPATVPDPEYRRDPITGRWVIIAPERSRRPLGLASTKPHPRRDAERDSCPFCEGREGQSPPETFAYRRPGTIADDPGWTLRVVPNKFPAVRETVQPITHENSLFESSAGFGLHEVVIECPFHESNPARLPESQLAAVFTAYRERLVVFNADPRVAYVSIFKNVGAEAGASLAHSHSQIIALPIVPDVVRGELDGSRHAFERTDQCLFCEIIESELAEQSRVIGETPRFVAIAPYASRFAYEIWVLPRSHESRYETLTDEAACELAVLMRSLMGKLDAVLSYPAYNYYMHTGPAKSGPLPYYHWHIELFPRTSRVAGFEWASGCFINAMPPERAAAELRAAEPPPVDDVFGA